MRAIDSPHRDALLRTPAEPGLAIDSPHRDALLRTPAEPGLAIDTPHRDALLRTPAEPGLAIRIPRKSRGQALALATLAAAAVLARAPAARAEGCPDEAAETGEKKQGKFHIEYINGKPVTVIDTVVSVCGKVPRPSVVYVLTAKNIEYEWESLKQDFMPLILSTVKKAPF